MRMARLAIAVVASLAWASAVNANEASVTEIEAQIERIQAQYQSAEQRDEQLRGDERQLREQLQELRERSEALEMERREALAEMNERYQLVVTNPSTDISKAVQAYQAAVDAHQNNLNRIRQQVTRLSEKQQEIQQSGLSRHALVNRLESFEERLEIARVERARAEYNRRGSIEASHSLSCARTETFQACEERGKQLARQRASQEYANRLFNNLSEKELAQQNREASGASVRVLGSRVVSGGFSGQGEYTVNLQVELEGKLQGNQACTLLSIDSRYCSSGSAQVETTTNSSQGTNGEQGVMHQTTIRSNVYGDEVFIDGVSYGSTPLNLMLPAGEHDIVVSKHGYDGHSKRASIREATTLRFELTRSSSPLVRGERVQDALYGDVKGPDLIVVPAGRAQVGDQTGHGRPEERPVRSVRISEMFGVGVYPITVAQFRDFVAATDYKTEAELAKGCAALTPENGVEWDEARNWRTPGFEQAANSPVVCVSFNDAQAYVSWLTQVTGSGYKLPTEAQWEYTARAGTETDYWWGNSVGMGRANCRTCDGQWSNIKPSPVGVYPANSWGLHEIVGNVWEWTTDERSGSPILKGGAFNFAASLARSAARLDMPAEFRANYVGIRVIRTQ